MYMTATTNVGDVLQPPVGTIVSGTATYRVGEDGVSAITRHSAGFVIMKGEDIVDLIKIPDVRAVYRYPAD